MNILRKASTTAALSVAGAGIAVGAVGLAAADSTTEQGSSSSTSAAPSAAGEGRGHGHGPGGRDGRGGRGGPGELAPGLAEALGLEESDVTAALAAVHDQREAGASTDGEERTKPTAAEREERRAELAAALADELDVSEQSVTEALATLATERAAAGRSSLAERLDTAVADGSLDAADKQSVLKAYDAGVLGGGRGPGAPTG